ncbi:hypothetical protein S7711_01050 [Stachybotrys chartarum IBT 7711]|uniref:UDP-glucuronic acid decarboxylase 1 n=1 Tax=Stachybotrys chartarum (strain CBS 109288 / IBT 7711) TaxID=1280523 RepID=A0A084B497_STACB|nr:hypothetical protein S7711_01050 [Stachybotrys chartarum IBT 7711]
MTVCMNVLVTGVSKLVMCQSAHELNLQGAGFLGHHLVQLLLHQGHNVTVVDSLWTGFEQNVRRLERNPRFTYLTSDVRVDFPDLGHVDQIYHLACPASPDHFDVSPIEILETCFRGTKNVLDLAVRYKARVLLASTSEIYGDPHVVPQSERYCGNVNCFGPRSCYDEGKRVAESLAYAYRAQHGIEVRIARIFNAYGPHMKLTDGRAVPNFIAAAMEGKPIAVYGDGSATRCFQYATDCVGGLAALMNSEYQGPVNIGSDREMPVGEIADMIARLVASKLGDGAPVPIRYLPKREDDPVRRKPDITVAWKQLGWRPRVSLEEGIDRTIDWFLDGGHEDEGRASRPHSLPSGTANGPPDTPTCSSDDDDDLNHDAPSAGYLSSVEDLSEESRAEQARSYPGRPRSRGRGGMPFLAPELGPKTFFSRLARNVGSLRRLFRPWRSLGSGVNRRAWSRVPENDPGSLDDAMSFAQELARHPEKRGTMRSLRDMMLSSWLNGLLVFVPIGLFTYVFKMSPILVFTSNIIAIVPLSSLLTEATEMIASDAGDAVGALLNISLGNLVELILFVALANDHIRIVQASILGSILVNLLLILGSALLANNLIPNNVPICNTNETQLLACLLFVSVFVFLMPTAFDYTYDHEGADGAILQMSRISAIMVLAIYFLYFVHELRSRPDPARPNGEDVEAEGRSHMAADPAGMPRSTPGSLPLRTIRFADERAHSIPTIPESPTPKTTTERIELGTLEASAAAGDGEMEERARRSFDGATRPNLYQQAYRPTRAARSGSLGSNRGVSHLSHLGRETSVSAAERVGLMRSGLTSLHMLQHGRPSMESLAYEQPALHRPTGSRAVPVFVLILTSALMSMSAEFLVSTIDDVTHQGGLSEAVIGLIILPIVGNIAEYVTVVTVAARNKLDLAIAVAVGSSIQIALCVTPLTVIAGWIMHRNLALTFNYFEMATLLGTVLLVNLLILNDGSSSLRTSGLKGALMCACYVIIGLGAYLSPSE